MKFFITKQMSELAQQVSHDIRSPLSALNMMLMDLKELPSKAGHCSKSPSAYQWHSQLLAWKSKAKTVSIPHKTRPRLMARHLSGAWVVLIFFNGWWVLVRKANSIPWKADVSIEDLTKAYGYFTTVNATELKRVLSNLINNSIEAFPEGRGESRWGFVATKDVVQIIISDNGKGIPASVLAKLGERGWAMARGVVRNFWIRPWGLSC